MKRLDRAVKEFLATTRKSPASAPRDELHASVEREYEKFSQRTSVLLELPAKLMGTRQAVLKYAVRLLLKILHCLAYKLK